MMKLSRISKIALAVALLCSSATGFAATYELTTLLGTPNQDMPFVRDAVKNHVEMVPGNNIADFTTGVIYFASKNGTESVQTIQIFQEGGNTTLSDVGKAIDLASANSAIVLAPITGSEVEEMCGMMMKKKDTAFLVTFGADGYNLSPLYTHCSSKNILFVTTLNKELTGLGDFTTYGPLVRLAVPGMDLMAPVDKDRRVSFLSDGFGMAVAAGQLSELSRKDPSLKGAALLAKFLEQADTLPSLQGKVAGSKAILRFAQ
ncbi:MAG: hypothetical protein ACXWQO_14580 [Bdellovibrionota bacterium]